jgi:hypothetical protein
LEKKMANGSIKDAPGIIPQPTLPNVSLDDDEGHSAGRARKLEAERAGMPISRSRSNNQFVEYDVYGGQAAYPPTVNYDVSYEDYGR